MAALILSGFEASVQDFVSWFLLLLHADTVAALILGGCDASVQDFVSLFFIAFCSFLRHFFSISFPHSFYFL